MPRWYPCWYPCKWKLNANLAKEKSSCPRCRRLLWCTSFTLQVALTYILQHMSSCARVLRFLVACTKRKMQNPAAALHRRHNLCCTQVALLLFCPVVYKYVYEYCNWLTLTRADVSSVAIPPRCKLHSTSPAQGKAQRSINSRTGGGFPEFAADSKGGDEGSQNLPLFRPRAFTRL